MRWTKMVEAGTASRYQKGSTPWNKGHAKQVEVSCRACSQRFVLKEYKLKWGAGKHCSRKCLGVTKSRLRGAQTPNYKKDRSLLAKRQVRNDSAYVGWRRAVWLRDNFKCKTANPNCAGRIEAHHILAWRDYPELRYQVNNGITLCHSHHPRVREEEKRLIPKFVELVSASND
jgi:hypothetical protein